MKLALIVHNEFFSSRVMELLSDAGVDYFTRWENVQGKGHGTQGHFGGARALGGYGAKNCVLMIAFEKETPLTALIDKIVKANAEIKPADDKIRLFLLPLDCVV